MRAAAGGDPTAAEPGGGTGRTAGRSLASMSGHGMRCVLRSGRDGGEAFVEASQSASERPRAVIANDVVVQIQLGLAEAVALRAP